MSPTSGSEGSGGGEGFAVPKSGDGRVALIGFPSVGKVSFLECIVFLAHVYANVDFMV